MAERTGVPVITEEEFTRRYRHRGDRVFHLFPKLPAELKLEVWKQAVKNLPVPKLQEFDFDFAYDPDAALRGRAGNGLIACFEPKRTHQLAGHLGLLTACIDSRKAFLDSSDYHMLPLTYLIGFKDKETPKKESKTSRSFGSHVKRKNTSSDKTYSVAESMKTTKRVGNSIFKVKKIAPPAKTTTHQVKSVTHKIAESHSQANKAFVRVLLPVSFEHTRFIIDKVAEPFAYESVHPTPPRARNAFSGAAGLEFVHSIKRLAFSQHKRDWKKPGLFYDWFATSPGQYRFGADDPPFTLGVLEELSFVSARAVERQCCIGSHNVWNSVPSIAVQQFDRRSGSTSREWEIRDLIGLHSALTNKWAQFHWDFNLRWGGSIRKKCTCRR